MTHTYALPIASDTHRVRLLLPDTRTPGHVLEDEEIEALLEMEGDDPKLATARGLELIASDRAMVQGYTRILDIQVDGTKVAAELRARAKALREEVAAGNTELAFDLAEFPHGIFAEREYAWNEALRG